MKKSICAFLAFIFVICLFSGCNTPEPIDNQNTQSDYPHSSIIITSGDCSIQPLQAELWSEERFGGNIALTDSMGADIFFDDKYISPDSIPTLVLSQDVTLSVPEGVTRTGNPKIYDTSFQILDTAPLWNELYLLGKGEYFIVFDEVWEVENADELRKSDQPFGRYGYENLFRLKIEE